MLLTAMVILLNVAVSSGTAAWQRLLHSHCHSCERIRNMAGMSKAAITKRKAAEHRINCNINFVVCFGVNALMWGRSPATVILCMLNAWPQFGVAGWQCQHTGYRSKIQANKQCVNFRDSVKSTLGWTTASLDCGRCRCRPYFRCLVKVVSTK